MMSGNLDLRLLLDSNSLVPWSTLGGKLFLFPARNAFVRAVPVFLPLVALWFSGESRARRSRMLIGLIAACVATNLSVLLQHHITFHIRPFLDPAVHLRGVDLVPASTWNRLGSFPSDTCTLFFSLATVIFLENRRAGILAFFWSLYSVGFLRVALGWHYPSDVLGAMVLGTASVYALTTIRYLRTFFERMLERWEPRIYIIHALLFLFLADAYNLFPGLQGVLRGAQSIGGFLIKR